MAHVLEGEHTEEHVSPRTMFEDRERDCVKLTPRRHFRSYGRNHESNQTKKWNIFQYGVRAPVLADIRDNKSFSCRFDKVEPLNKLTDPRADGVLSNRCSTKDETIIVTRGAKNSVQTPRLAYTSGEYPDESLDCTKSSGKKLYTFDRQQGDVRDVMYRNTFYPDELKLRYRISNLPRVPSIRRSADSSRTSLQTDESVLDTGDAMPSKCAVLDKYSRFSLDRLNFKTNQQNPSTSACMEIRKVGSFHQPVTVHKGGGCEHSAVKEPPRQNGDNNQKDKHNNGRPLKSENVRYRPSTMSVKLPSAEQFSSLSGVKDFKSADRYRDYIQRVKESTTLSGVPVGAADGTSGRQNTTVSQYNFEANLLNSVICVNRPVTVEKPPASPVTSDEEDHPNGVMPEWVNIEKSGLELM